MPPAAPGLPRAAWRPGALDGAFDLHEFVPGATLLARDADVFVAEASYPERVPGDSVQYLSSARQAGQTAAAAGARRLLLTHLLPGTEQDAAIGAAAAGYDGDVSVAAPGVS